MEALARQTHPDLELVVVDNGSNDDSLERLRRAWPSGRGPIKIHENRRNRGFAVACQQAFEHSTGGRVLWLNPDTVAEPDLVSRLSEALCGGGAAMAAPAITLPGGLQLENAGQGICRDGLNFCRGRFSPCSEFDQPETILLFSGACVLWDRTSLHGLGPLDPRFFAYGEDAELGLRAARAGLHAIYVPDARLTHQLSSSLGRGSLAKAFLVERNRWRIAVTHLPASWLMQAPVHAAYRLGLTAVAGIQGRGVVGQVPGWRKAALPAVVAGAWVAAIAGLPRDLRRRREEEARATLKNDAWLALLQQHEVPLSEAAQALR